MNKYPMYFNIYMKIGIVVEIPQKYMYIREVFMYIIM
jgi:hypothetical protein